MKTFTINIIIACVLIAACDIKTNKYDRAGIEDTIISRIGIEDSMTTQSFDTTIHLSGITKSNYGGQTLTSDFAKKILYSYFKTKGYYTSDNLPDMEKMTDSENNKLSVDYDTIFITDLNGSKNVDAIITYWLTPPYASGHCWRTPPPAHFPLFNMISAAITPGIQPARVKRKTINTDPQPLSITESGGKMIARMTRRSDICDSVSWWQR